MANRYIPVSTLTHETKDWMIKVIVTEKSPIYPGRDQSSWFIRLMFSDEQHESIQAIAFNRDVNYIHDKLQLYETYYIANAALAPITDARNQASSIPLQLMLSKATFIKTVNKTDSLQLMDHFPITSFWNLDKYKNSDAERFNILCIAIHAFPEEIVSTARGPRRIRKFIVVNPECRPMIFTLWEPYVYYEGVELINTIHTHPAILIIRPRITTYHGIDISTRPNSTIVLDPPLHQTAALKTWTEENISYIHRVINERLYEKNKQKTAMPASTEIRLIAQILASSNLIKNFWIKGKIRIINYNQRFFFATCTACNKVTGAPMDMEFDCNFCGLKDTKAKPKAKFQVQIYDDTGFIEATVDDIHAETLLDFNATEIYQKHLQGESLPFSTINQKLQNQNFFCEMRSYLPSQRHPLPLFFVTAFIPEKTPEQPVTGHIAETESSQFPATPTSFLKTTTTNIPSSIQQASSTSTPTSALSVVPVDQSSDKGPSSSVKNYTNKYKAVNEGWHLN